MDREISKKTFNNLFLLNDFALLNEMFGDSKGINAFYFREARKKLNNELYKMSAKIAKEMTVKQIEHLQKRARGGNKEAIEILDEITKKISANEKEIDIRIREEMFFDIINAGCKCLNLNLKNCSK